MNRKINKKIAFGRRLTSRGSQSWSRNKSWSESGSINLDLDPMTLTYELNLDILKIQLYTEKEVYYLLLKAFKSYSPKLEIDLDLNAMTLI